MKINPAQTALNIPTDSKQAHKANQSFSQIMDQQLQAEQKHTASTPVPAAKPQPNASSNQHNSSTQDQPQTTGRSEASIEFQEYMSKNDAEKMRLSVLKEMGLTEEEFEQLPPEAQFAIEQKIIERLKQQNGVDSTELNTQTAKLF